MQWIEEWKYLAFLTITLKSRVFKSCSVYVWAHRHYYRVKQLNTEWVEIYGYRLSGTLNNAQNKWSQAAEKGFLTPCMRVEETKGI